MPDGTEDRIVVVTGISIGQSDVTLEVGDVRHLSATLEPANATNKSIIWKSSDQTIVSIDSEGKITAINKGSSTITVVSGDNEQIKDELVIEVFEEQGDEAFITTWNTELGTPSEPTVVIPTFSGESYDYDIDWGDGTFESNVTGDATHVYDEHGIYEIKITGQFPRIYFNTQHSASSTNLISVDQWGSGEWTSMENAFGGCLNLDILATDSPDLRMVTSMKKMFELCRNLKGSNSMNSWDVSGIIDMTSLFNQCDKFDSDISSWNTSKVEDMTFLFNGCDIFNQDIGEWDVSSVKNMVYMFNSCSTFNQDIGNWDTKEVTNMNHIFKSCTVFNQDISSWDVSKVTDMGGMFLNAESFNQPIGNWNVSSVIDMSSMLQNASSFNQDISSWDVSNVSNMRAALAQLKDFNVDISGWDVQNVENMGALFAGCSSFNQDLSSWDVSKVTNMRNMFDGTIEFNQDISGWDVSNVTTMEEMFRQATSFDQNLGSWNVSNVQNMIDMFDGVQLSTANYDALLEGWSSLPSLQVNVQFSAGNGQFCNAESARQNIVSNFSWTIIDGGLNCD